MEIKRLSHLILYSKQKCCNIGQKRCDSHPGGGWHSLIRAEWGRAASQGMFFEIFVLNRVSILSIFVWLDCLQSAFSLKIRPDETRKDSLCTDVPPPSGKKNVSYFFFSGLRPRFSRQAASPLACLGFVCSNFAKKNKRLLVV